MFDFGRANEAQQEAIKTVNGPVLITAGPGTGKTYTLVQRTVYMIQEHKIKPEEIMITTFTEKAAKEIITRISNELIEKNIAINLNEMYIGTFHSICLRIIKENIEYSQLTKNFRTLDDFDQNYLVFQNIRRFRNIFDFDLAIEEQGAWRQAKEICRCVNNLSEEMVSAEELMADKNPAISAMGRILEQYQLMLEENNLLDFSNIQTEAFRLINDNEEVLEKLRNKIKYLMIDEYQDTNYIQEQLIFLLASEDKNICVVGDDDQGLYRFRGATIRNILQFPQNFPEGVCKVIALTENYRSNRDIVDFYNKWMTTTSGAKFAFNWGKYRHNKRIVAHKEEYLSSPTTIKIAAEDDVQEWHEAILDFINTLKDSGKISDLNQIAFLFNSVKSARVIGLAKFLEENGIDVYSPRSDLFFEREEVRLLFGALLIMFPRFVSMLEKREFNFSDENLCRYYEDCIKETIQLLKKPEYKELKAFIRERGKSHISLERNTDYAFTGLIYQLFEFEPFHSIIDADMSSGLIDLRPVRNISKLTEIFGKYEYLHRIDVFTDKRIDKDVELLFNMFFRFLYNGGIDEYEDDSEYAPSGCVSFLTIHQSKGMEFPIVVVGSLGNLPRNRNEGIIGDIAEKYYKKPPFEPYEQIKFFDFWRLYYTAFSRAQDLLVLTANETSREPSLYFGEVYDELINYDAPEFSFEPFDFEDIKDVNLKEKYSFTSHISVYENCSLQYKFFKELSFTPIRVGATLFGQIIHQTIEDVHKAALRHEAHLITEDNVRHWLLSNYVTLSKIEHSYLGQPQIEAAANQVLRYVDRQGGDWSHIQEAEVEVSLVKKDYIIEGKIDLIRGDGDTVELIDFKSEKKPDIFKDKEKIDHYKRQLQVYAHLVEEKTGHKVSKLHLYYTGEESGNPQISFPSVRADIETTIESFDETVHKIQNKDFCHKSKNQILCNNCDFRFFCAK